MITLRFFDSIIHLSEIDRIGLSGLTDELFGVYVNDLIYQKKENSILVVASSLYEANQLYNVISNYYERTFLFPMDDFLTSEAIAVSPDLMVTRLETINSLLDDKNKLARLSINAYESSLKFSNKVFASNVLKIYKIAIKKGRKHLFKRLFKGDKNDSSR